MGATDQRGHLRCVFEVTRQPIQQARGGDIPPGGATQFLGDFDSKSGTVISPRSSTWIGLISTSTPASRPNHVEMTSAKWVRLEVLSRVQVSMTVDRSLVGTHPVNDQRPDAALLCVGHDLSVPTRCGSAGTG